VALRGLRSLFFLCHAGDVFVGIEFDPIRALPERFRPVGGKFGTNLRSWCRIWLGHGGLYKHCGGETKSNKKSACGNYGGSPFGAPPREIRRFATNGSLATLIPSLSCR
jgi:hypothetical protein